MDNLEVLHKNRKQLVRDWLDFAKPYLEKDLTTEDKLKLKRRLEILAVEYDIYDHGYYFDSIFSYENKTVLLVIKKRGSEDGETL